MNLWWKLTVECPAALGDWLWKVLIKWPAESLKRVTFRGVLVSVLVLLIAYLLIQAAIPIEMAFFAAGDTLVYMEALTIVALIASRGHFRQMQIILERRAKEAWNLLARTSAFLKIGSRWQAPSGCTPLARPTRSVVQRRRREPLAWGAPSYA